MSEMDPRTKSPYTDTFIRKPRGPVMEFVAPDGTDAEGAPLMPYLRFPKLAAAGEACGARHMVATRLGGVSEGIFESMNFLTRHGDPWENIYKNYDRVGAILGLPAERFAHSMQKHTTNLRVVTEEDAGKFLFKPIDYDHIDGLITNVPGLVLAIYCADCVPVLILDPVRKAIANVHSGWRGTVGRISAKAIGKMTELYGTDPKDLYVGVAPSICKDCYEVSWDVAEAFMKEFEGHEEEIMTRHLWTTAEEEAAGAKGPQADRLAPPDGEDADDYKYQLDLWESIRITLLEAGVPEDHIEITDICTMCNPDFLFSERFTKGKRGVGAAFLTL